MGKITLESLKYSEQVGGPLQWSIDCLVFGQINLLVGKNATGKTRALNVTGNLAKLLLADKLVVDNGNYEVVFKVDGKELRLILRYEGGKVLEEKVIVDNAPKLKRENGILEIWYEEANKWIEHEPSDNQLSVSSRKDKKQHPFLLPLDEWAQGVRHYTFGASLGKNHLGYTIKVQGETPEIDDRNQDMVVAIFEAGKKAKGDEYINALIADLKELDYPLSAIDSTTPEHIRIGLAIPGTPQPVVAGQLRALGVREEGVGGMFFQDSISQGMFRAISILVQVNYSQMMNRANCIIIDDIGEGLDFSRSAKLIELLRRKAKHSEFQLIMATNDQFVMNHVPLDEWSVLQRAGNRITVRNIHNSKEAFEDFKFVGLSNFAFFELDFANGAPDERQMTLEATSSDE